MRPLSETLRGKMEAAFRADFTAVRVHVGPQAERIGAVAFTSGTDIFTLRQAGTSPRPPPVCNCSATNWPT